jgi:NADH-quinone oxidoreductase subunit J
MLFTNILFVLSAIITLGFAFMVVYTKNLMHACIYLLFCLLGISGLYASMGAEFVAVTQIMVYVGGIVVLMLFAIMLTGGKDFKSRGQELLRLIPGMGNKKSYSTAAIISLVMLLGLYKLYKIIPQVVPNKVMGNDPTIDQLGKLLLTDHVLVFELSSVLLLGALIGAAIIARPEDKKVGK